MRTTEDSVSAVKKQLKEYDPKSTNRSKHYLVAIVDEPAELREFLQRGQQSGDILFDTIFSCDPLKE